MTTSSIPLYEDDDDVWYWWGHSVFVPHIPNTRAYPYVSRIMGPDPKYRFARKFLQYQWPPKTAKGRRFDVELHPLRHPRYSGRYPDPAGALLRESAGHGRQSQSGRQRG